MKELTIEERKRIGTIEKQLKEIERDWPHLDFGRNKLAKDVYDRLSKEYRILKKKSDAEKDLSKDEWRIVSGFSYKSNDGTTVRISAGEKIPQKVLKNKDLLKKLIKERKICKNTEEALNNLYQLGLAEARIGALQGLIYQLRMRKGEAEKG